MKLYIMKAYLRKHSKGIIILAAFFMIYYITFYLYQLPTEAVLYATILCILFVMLLFIPDYLHFRKKHIFLLKLKKSITVNPVEITETMDLIEKDYKELLDILFTEKSRLETQASGNHMAFMDYYTMWAHQIKTPISAMRLLLQSMQPEIGDNTGYQPDGQPQPKLQSMQSDGGDNTGYQPDSQQQPGFQSLQPDSGNKVGYQPDSQPQSGLQSIQSDNMKEIFQDLNGELFKIEQYTEMALTFIRMESMSSDLLLEKYPLDSIIKQTIHKLASFFIYRRISLNFSELNIDVLTDDKWISFVLEQILSNALKYTGEGGCISIYMDDIKPKTLVIEDNGIGIDAEDLPRVFEKGFTGYNGRSDKKSTGIGLYLCKGIIRKLSHTIEIESEPGKGTKVKIGFDTVDLKTE